MYSRLALEGYRVARRTNSVSDTDYLEMYAPIRVPGAPAQELIVLSMPLLAQQEQVEQEIAGLRSGAFLVTCSTMMTTAPTPKIIRRDRSEIMKGTRLGFIIAEC